MSDATRSAASSAARGGFRLAAVLGQLPLVLLAAVVAALILVPHYHAGSPTLIRAGILVAFAIVCWVFELFREPVTSLLFMLLAILFHIAKPEVVFSGYTSTAWWLVFGGTITAVAVQTTGLGRRIAAWLFARAGGSYPRAVTAVGLAAVGLAFVMPSTGGRVMLLTPIVMAFAEHLGFSPGRRGYTALIVTTATVSFMPATTILPANVPNSILLGASESLYNVHLTYGPYLLLHFPVLGVLKAAVLIWLAIKLFPEREPIATGGVGELGPMSRDEKRLSAVLILSLVLFATDFLHGISPAWISLGTGVACLMPPLSLIPPKGFQERFNIINLVYIGGILGLGAVVADSGLSELASATLMQWADLTPGHTLANVGVLSAIGAGMTALVTSTAVPAVLTPLAGEFATASGLPLLSVLMLQVVAFSTIFLPYESPPMMIGLNMAGVGARSAGRLCLAAAAVTVLVLLPLDYLWWTLLGYLP
jgi:anion transporter